MLWVWRADPDVIKHSARMEWLPIERVEGFGIISFSRALWYLTAGELKRNCSFDYSVVVFMKRVIITNMLDRNTSYHIHESSLDTATSFFR